MAEFSSGYYHAMDRDYEVVNVDGKRRNAILDIRSMGISTPPFKDQLEGLQARIKQGASSIELGFTGVGKGSMAGSSTTPEMVPKWQREAIRDLAKINELKITTHASVGISSLAGLTQHGFSEEMREKSLNEIKRAVEFAADTTQGGPIVVHLGEFQRSIYEKWRKQGFTGYENEDKHAEVHLVDKRTGEIVAGLTRSKQFPWPVWKTDEKGEVLRDVDGNPFPVFDDKEGIFKTRMVGWDFFEKEAERWNKAHPGEKKSVAKYFHEAYLDQQERQARGWAKNFAEGFEELTGQLEELEKEEKYYEKIFENMSPEDRKNWVRKPGESDPLGFSNKGMDPLDIIERKIKERKLGLEHRREASLSYAENLEQIKSQKENTVLIEEYGVKKTADTIARAAEFAMAKSKGLEKPLFVAPENVFPEQYGSHPQELKEVILAARERFVERMGQKGMSEGEAKRLASQHIKATFDVGHANTWKKYYQGDPKKSYEENEKDFRKWLVEQVKDLAKSDIIGHIHISDNFGYEDEHLTPGQGNTPIKEFLEEMKKAGLKEVIVEPAHQDYLAMYGGWREFGGSIYGAQLPTMPKRSWSDIEFSYFGQARTPYFIFGGYKPSEDWTLWSDVPLE